MSPSENTIHEAKNGAKSLVDTVFDLGTTWAALGLNVGKNALLESAKALETTASTLADLAKRIAPEGRGGLGSDDGRSRDEAVPSRQGSQD